MKPPNVIALETKLGATLVQCPNCDAWHRDVVLCGFVGCERDRERARKAAGNWTGENHGNQ